MTDKSALLKKYIKAFGKEFTFVDSNGNDEVFYALTNQTWRKNKSKFKNSLSKAGLYYNSYYMYYGPYDFDIFKIPDDGYIISDGQKFEFVRREKIEIGGNTQYYTGVLRKIIQEGDDVF